MREIWPGSAKLCDHGPFACHGPKQKGGSAPSRGGSGQVVCWQPHAERRGRRTRGRAGERACERGRQPGPAAACVQALDARSTPDTKGRWLMRAAIVGRERRPARVHVCWHALYTDGALLMQRGCCSMMVEHEWLPTCSCRELGPFDVRACGDAGSALVVGVHVCACACVRAAL